ncbi:MAG: sigma 54-interacting transcriptional regulator [Holophagales bacterium]|nr:MAG: sigma 54-interacting transcriptional regulator [Holophagales bacterium]
MRRLLVLHGELVRELVLAEKEGVLGSASSNALVLPFPGVSRRHARFELVSGGVRLIDLGSKNGLVVAGRRVAEVLLTPGVSVRIGYIELRLLDASAGDLEIALSLGETERTTEVVPDPSASRGGHGEEGAARHGIVLIREVETMSRAMLGQRRSSLFERVRTILGAELLVLVDLADRARPAVQELAGDLEGDDLEAVLERVPVRLRRRGAERFAAQGRWQIAWRPDGLAAIAARTAALADAGSLWRRALLEYLLLKLSGGGVEKVASPLEVTHEDLRLPDGAIFGSAPATRDLLQRVRAALSSRADVLLLGESGTGKELVARLLHGSGARGRGPFVPVSCPALPGELLEAELFGVVDRAATGVAARPGHFASAHGGTLLLDEIGDMSPALQAKLLRVLQEREVWPLGASQARKVDVRVIAATNRDLPAMVRDGSFRADLYYRLRQLEIRVPPLRERREDIPALVLAFARRFAAEYHKSLRGVSRRALELLMAYDWPGNVRDLESEILRAVVACPSGDLLRSEHLHLPEPAATESSSPSSASTGFSPAARSGLAEGPERAERHARIDREAIRRALEATSGNKAAAARLLDLSREGLRKKMKRLGLG